MVVTCMIPRPAGLSFTYTAHSAVHTEVYRPVYTQPVSNPSPATNVPANKARQLIKQRYVAWPF